MGLGWIIALSIIGVVSVVDSFFMYCALRLSAKAEEEYYSRQNENKKISMLE